MESTDKLRNYVSAFISPGAEADLLDFADEIEREIAEHYLLLPVDADGVTIRCGDVVDGGMGDSGKVQHVELWPDGFVIVYECHPGTFTRYAPDAVRHVKPRTVEDVLRDMLNAYDRHEDGDMPYSFIAEYADELRSMGVGE